MSFKCMETECRQIATKECNCKIPTRYCKDHMKLHGNSFKCYKKSIQNVIDNEMIKIRHAKFHLREVTRSLIEYSEKLVKIIMTTLAQKIAEIETQTTIIDNWLIDDHEISLNRHMSGFKIYNIEKWDIESFTNNIEFLFNSKPPNRGKESYHKMNFKEPERQSKRSVEPYGKISEGYLDFSPQSENAVYDYQIKNPPVEGKKQKKQASKSKAKNTEPKRIVESKVSQKDYDFSGSKTQSYATNSKDFTKSSKQGEILTKHMPIETSKRNQKTDL
ncbi:hypothetical protein SteCoe_14052 [Stentor coeruleus]|uniref:Uncharacterized protein n=1 Tax=Stentor coeruleus TaxID=5963 RepID=A0A1R2C711_9CILI|nr:hypothetical protein SteCoe_14052 [Stentor coeruleus]